LLLIKNLLFTFLVPGTVAVLVPYSLSRDATVGSMLFLVPASLLYLVGGAIYSWCVWDFASFGRGTPAPIDAPKKLVARGLYRYTRNPMYVGVLTVLLGWVVLYRDPQILVYATFVAAAFQGFVLFYEEPHLTRVFGDEYLVYKQRVGRWWPRKPRKPDRATKSTSSSE
jgi:protein-S-isoprenylcysteine O-methyltransferase Ste14